MVRQTNETTGKLGTITPGGMPANELDAFTLVFFTSNYTPLNEYIPELDAGFFSPEESANGGGYVVYFTTTTQLATQVVGRRLRRVANDYGLRKYRGVGGSWGIRAGYFPDPDSPFRDTTGYVSTGDYWSGVSTSTVQAAVQLKQAQVDVTAGSLVQLAVQLLRTV